MNQYPVPPRYQNIIQTRPRRNRVVISVTKEKLNPHMPRTATHYDSQHKAYTLFKLNEDRTRPTRVITGPTAEPSWHIGSVIDVVDGSSGKTLGEYMIVGVQDFDNGEHAGELIDRALAHGLM